MRLPGSGPKSDEMPFLEHLEELRWHILWSMVAVLVGTVIGFVLVTQFAVLGYLIDPIRPYLPDGKLGYLSPADPFMVTLRLAIVVGLILAAPIVVYHVWSFVSPALMPEEKRAIVPSLYLGLVLFAAGAALAYFAALPVTLRFFMGFQVESLEQNIIIGPYMGLVVKILLAFGLVFELPVVILILAVLGIVDSRMLASKRRYAMVLSVVVASVITPGDVVVLTVFMAIPMLLLYELSIGLTKLVERRRARLERKREAAGEPGEQWVPS